MPSWLLERSVREACYPGSASAADMLLYVECRIAPLTSLIFAELKGWEAIETIHLGIADLFQVNRVDYTTRTKTAERSSWVRHQTIGKP